MTKKTLSALLAVCLAASLLFTACSSGGKIPKPPYEVPAWLTQKWEQAEGKGEKKEIQVDFYYDNTISMDGFVRDDDFKHGSPDSDLVRLMAALRNINREYSAVCHTMQPNAEGVLQWSEYQEDLYDHFASKDFYTYTGSLPAKQGPLRALFFDDGVVNPENINVIVTDLAEQNVNNTELAHQINSKILSQEGYSAAIMAIQLEYNGNASVPDPNQLSTQIDHYDTNADRPFYLIFTGPEEQLERYLKDFQAAFKDAEEGDDYFLSVYHPGNGVQAVDLQDIKVAPSAVYDKLIKPELADNPALAINKNLSVERIADTGIQELFETPDYLNLFAFRYQQKNETKTSRMVLNYYVPLYSDGGEVAFTVGDRLRETGNQEVDELLAKREYLTYSYLSPSADSSSPSDDNAKDYEWKNLSTQLDLDNEIKVSYDPQPIRAGDVMDYSNSDVLPQNYTPQPLFSSSDYTGSFTPDTPMIHIRVEASAVPPSMAGSTVVFNLPIYAVSLKEQDFDLPEWVGEFDSGDSKDYIEHTYNLEGFYKTLFGLNEKDDKQLTRAQRERKIADITTAVTSLPVREK